MKASGNPLCEVSTGPSTSGFPNMLASLESEESPQKKAVVIPD